MGYDEGSVIRAWNMDFLFMCVTQFLQLVFMEDLLWNEAFGYKTE